MSVAVLLLAYGTPASIEEMPEYLTRVRGGRPPSDALVAEMRRHYAAIGGRSPLADITRAQAEALSRKTGRPVYVGMRYSHPFVTDQIARASADGVTRLLAIPLAPQCSARSVAEYRESVERALTPGLAVSIAASYHRHPLLLEAFAERLRARGPAGWDRILFTAHSLPVRLVDGGDPYRDQVEATAAGVAERAGAPRFHLAYQSAGRTDEAWLGPSLVEALAEAARSGVRRVLVCPIGFLSDNAEILYDLDVQAREAALALGIELARTESLNTHETLVSALAQIVEAGLE